MSVFWCVFYFYKLYINIQIISGISFRKTCMQTKNNAQFWFWILNIITWLTDMNIKRLFEKDKIVFLSNFKKAGMAVCIFFFLALPLFSHIMSTWCHSTITSLAFFDGVSFLCLSTWWQYWHILRLPGDYRLMYISFDPSSLLL